MPKNYSREIRLKQSPIGVPTSDNFGLEFEVPELTEGEFLVKNIWMSVDPYVRGRMTERKSHLPQFEVGKALKGHCVGEVRGWYWL